MGSAVVQFEIGGPDDQLLAGFYGALFGWEMTPIPGASYTLIAASGPGIGGGLGRSRTGEPWATFYAEADDPQAVLDRAAALGGNTVVPVTQIPGKLSYAMLADPDGLLVGVVRHAAMEVPVGRARPGGVGASVAWLEVRGSDAGTTRRFYTALFGWNVVAAAGSYDLVTTGAAHGVAGGLGAGQAARWATVYARVPDVAQALARAVELGGWREYGPEPAAGHREAGAFRDPAGNVFGVYHHTAH
jgi:predicted enzyme related to lactoylglutathione lyase